MHTPVPELEILAGQHRKHALKQCLEELGQPLQEHFWWVCNVYDLTLMPANIRLELTANIVGPKKITLIGRDIQGYACSRSSTRHGRHCDLAANPRSPAFNDTTLASLTERRQEED